jgi:hypothetical protein
MDRDDRAEVQQRLNRIEHAIVLLAGGTNGNGGVQGTWRHRV